MCTYGMGNSVHRSVPVPGADMYKSTLTEVPVCQNTRSEESSYCRARKVRALK